MGSYFDPNAYGAPTGASDFLKAWNEGVKSGQRDKMNRLLASGDLQGARQVAVRGGDFDYIQHIDGLVQSNRAQAAAHADLVGSAAFTLRQRPMEERTALFQNVIRPALRQQGIPDAELSQVDLSDAGLDSYVGIATSLKDKIANADKLAERNKPITANMEEDVIVPVTDSTGRVTGATTIHTGRAKLTSVSATNADGSSVQTPFNPYTGMYGRNAVDVPQGTMPQGQPTPDGPPADPLAPLPEGAPAPQSAPAMDVGPVRAGNRADRNGNPGNIRAMNPATGKVVGWVTKLPGYKGYDSGGYAIFDNPSSGASGAEALLGRYFKAGRNNISAIVERWAPRKSRGGDNTDAQVNNYIGYVASRLGVSPNAALSPDQIPQIAAAMHEFESGHTRRGGQQAAAPANDSPSAPAPAPQNDPYSFSGSRNSPAHVASPEEARGMGFNDGAVVYVNAKGEPMVKQAGSEAEGSMDDATLTMLAETYISTGQLPPLGMGKAAASARQSILSRAAKLAGGEGLSGNALAGQFARYRAQRSAVAEREKQYSAIEGNEQTAIANGRQYLDRSRDLSLQTKVPFINSVTQTYLRQSGDPTIAAMDAAMNTFLAEYQRVVNGTPNGGGVLTDSARHEAMDIMRGNYSVEQKQAAFAQMVKDMENRKAALRGSINNLYGGLSSKPTGNGAAPAHAPTPKSDGLPQGARVIGTYQGKRVIQLPNGKRMVEQ